MKEKNKKIDFSHSMNMAEESTGEVDLKILEARSEFAKTITELQREIEELKESIHYKDLDEKRELTMTSNKEDEVVLPINKDEKEEESLVQRNPISAVESNSGKVEKIKTLLNDGHTEEEVARELNIGKGEVLLIRELYKI